MADRSSERWWSKDTIALVTGANQGIGLQIVREFAKQGLTTILTSRDEARGKQAVDLLREEGLEVVYHRLDITSSDSVCKLVNWLSATYGGVDILVNNAGVLELNLDLERAKMVIETNYHGTRRMIEAIVPVMKPGARIVNVSSKASDLDYLKNEWRAKLEDIPNLTAKTIDEFLKQFLTAVGKGEVKSKGWPCMGYGTTPPEYLADYSASKMALNAYCRIVVENLKAKQISVNCMCPGATNTTMSNNVGHSVEMGADTAVWLALLPAEQVPVGRFFMNRKEVGFSGMPIFFDGQLFTSEEYQEKVTKLER